MQTLNAGLAEPKAEAGYCVESSRNRSSNVRCEFFDIKMWACNESRPEATSTYTKPQSSVHLLVTVRLLNFPVSAESDLTLLLLCI